MTMPKVLTRKEAARVLKVSVRTVDRAIEDGKLPCKVFGARKLILETGIEKLLSSLPDAVEKPESEGAP